MASIPEGGLRLHRYGGSKHIADIDGVGARLNGGRWNHPGTAVIYTSAVEEVAFSEYARKFNPRRVVLSTLTGLVRFLVPEGVSIEEVSIAGLPADWRRRPHPDALRDIGTAWAARMSSCILKVPTALNSPAFNYLINPEHPEFDPAWAQVIDPAPLTQDLVDASIVISPPPSVP